MIVLAREDLTFGQNAAKMGMRWGWFHEYVELTSPWIFKDFFTQRKRWIWGNIHAISHRDVLPFSRAVAIVLKCAGGGYCDRVRFHVRHRIAAKRCFAFVIACL